MIFFILIIFSSIIFYHLVWLGFELFGLRIQVCSQLEQFTLVRKGYDNHHYHNKPQIEMCLGCGWRHAEKRWAENFEDFEKRFSWVPTMVRRSWGPTMVRRSWGPTMVRRSWGPTMVRRSWGPTMVRRSWGPTMVRRSWGPTMVRRSWGPTMVRRSWGPTMVRRSWGPTMMLRSRTIELKVDIGPWRQRVEFSIVAAAVKFFGSRPAKVNWDLKHHKMCRMLGCC